MLRRGELAHVTAALAAGKIPVLVLKGAALAYSHYPAPALRPRLDTDLLIRAADRPGATRVLAALGYEALPVVAGAVIAHQAQFVRTTHGSRHVIDLHWKLLNPIVFADVVSFEEAWDGRCALGGLSPHAYALKPSHALLHLLVHRVAHHEPNSDLLGWYDMHVVAAALSDAEWDELCSLSETRGVAGICARGLAPAIELFSTTVPRRVATWVEAHAARPVPARLAMYLRPGRRLADVIRSDVAAAGWRDRWRLLRAHVAPPADYMHARFGTRRRFSLPFLYAWRLIRGVPRALARGRYR